MTNEQQTLADYFFGNVSVLGDGFLVPTPRLPGHGSVLIEDDSQDFCSAWVHRFWTILG